jgi:hypothetical protein
LLAAALSQLESATRLEFTAHECFLVAVAPVIWSSLQVHVAWRREKVAVPRFLAAVALLTEDFANP